MTLRGSSAVRTIWWAFRAGHRARCQLGDGNLGDLSLAAPPQVHGSCRRWVEATLLARNDSCLVRSAVLQAWDAARGERRDLIIGVTSPSEGFQAHAWLEGDGEGTELDFVELTRWSPPGEPAPEP